MCSNANSKTDIAIITNQEANKVDIIDLKNQKVISQIYDNIKTGELDEISANICTSLITTHPEYSKLGSRIIISNNQKNTVNNFGYKLIKDHNLWIAI